MSRSLWSNIETGSADSPTSSWSTSFERQARGSWFTAREQRAKEVPPASLQTISSPSPPSLWRAITECDLQKTGGGDSSSQQPPTKKLKNNKKSDKPPAGKASKIRVYPTKEQAQTLRRWFGTARWTYNQCLNGVEREGVPKNKKELRAKFLNAEAFEGKEELKWVLETPYDIRDQAMNDLLKAYKSAAALKKGGHVTRYTMKFRSKKAPTDCIAILDKHWGKTRGEFAAIFHRSKLKSAEPLPKKLGYDSRLIHTRLGEYFLCIPAPLDAKDDSQVLCEDDDAMGGIVSIDPGVRTFATGYDPMGHSFEWGKQDIGRVLRLCKNYDLLQSRWMEKKEGGKTYDYALNHNKRRNLKRAGLKNNRRIRNIVDECHKKLVRFLVTSYRVILLPEFNSSDMVKKAKRRIGSKTARNMLTWSHYRFRQRLIQGTREHPHCRVILCNESYTSKTCGKCGRINTTLGSAKHFVCRDLQCGFDIDRDLNGARNILLKYITENKSGIFRGPALTFSWQQVDATYICYGMLMYDIVNVEFN